MLNLLDPIFFRSRDNLLTDFIRISNYPEIKPDIFLETTLTNLFTFRRKIVPVQPKMAFLLDQHLMVSRHLGDLMLALLVVHDPNLPLHLMAPLRLNRLVGIHPPSVI